MMGDRKRNAPSNTYEIAPAQKDKFPVGKAKQIISETLHERLHDKKYQADHTSTWTKEVADEVKSRLKAFQLPRYKLMVQAVVGEKRGQGVRMGTRCFWNSSTDFSASASFQNESIFAVVVAYAVYQP